MGTGVAMKMAKTGWRGPGLSLPLIAALALVSACGEDTTGGFRDIGEAAVQIVRGGKGDEGVTASDAELRNFGKPLLKITQMKAGGDVVLAAVGDRPEGVTWRSADSKTLSFRKAVLVATRGLGNDLMSAQEPDIRSGPGKVVRDHYYLGGDEDIRRMRFICTLSDQGPQRIAVTGVAFDTRLVVEDCVGDTQQFTNRYWIQPDSGIRRSEQWAGPEIGTLLVEAIPQAGGGGPSTPQPQVFVISE